MDKDQLSLAELSLLIKNTLDAQLEPSYWVVAEVGELRMNHSGHCYMELIDKKEDKLVAKLKATCWSYAYRTISVWFEQTTGQPLAPGMKILANVVVQYHELYGLSLNVRDIDPNYTLGERARRRQEVINRLIQEGVYDMNQQLSLPLVPQRIAVISSPTAAGWGDFVNQLIPNPFSYRFDVRLFKAIMQGEQAEASIIKALEHIYAQEEAFDLVVLIRGGGAQTDLDCFDGYNLAAHLAQFPLPVLTGIGHERDETIADLVAHTKLKTPTAVAEFLLSGVRSFEECFLGLAEQIFSYTADFLEDQDRKLEQYGKSIYTQSLFAFRQSRQKTEMLSNGLQKGIHLLLKEKQKQLETLNLSWQRCLTAGVKHQKLRLSHLEKTIELLKPENTLKRGYSITYANGKLVKNSSTLQEGDELKTRTSKGELISIVKNVNLTP